MARRAFLLTLVLLATAFSSAGRAQTAGAWQVQLTSDSGEAYIAGATGSRLSVHCDSLPQPTVTIGYIPPAGVRLPPRIEGDWAANIGFRGVSGLSGLFLFDERQEEEGSIYSLSGQADMFSGDVPHQVLREIVRIVELLERARSAEVTSAEGSGETMAPLFRDSVSLVGSKDAIREALVQGGCSDLLARTRARSGG